jgi:hypothetical protein
MINELVSLVVMCISLFSLHLTSAPKRRKRAGTLLLYKMQSLLEILEYLKLFINTYSILFQIIIKKFKDLLFSLFLIETPII